MDRDLSGVLQKGGGIRFSPLPPNFDIVIMNTMIKTGTKTTCQRLNVFVSLASNFAMVSI